MQLIKLTQGKFAIVDDGDFEWLNQWKWLYAKAHCDGYAGRTIYLGKINGKKRYKLLFLHHVILEKHGLLKKGFECDHINRNKLDNRKENFRVATRRQNGINVGLQKNNSTGLKGVIWDTFAKRWRAQIRVNYKRIHLGRFFSKEGAALAYNLAAKKYFGNFAYFNQIGIFR